MLIIIYLLSLQKYCRLVIYLEQVYDLWYLAITAEHFFASWWRRGEKIKSRDCTLRKGLIPSNKLFLDLSHVVLQIVFMRRIKSSDGKWLPTNQTIWITWEARPLEQDVCQGIKSLSLILSSKEHVTETERRYGSCVMHHGKEKAN